MHRVRQRGSTGQSLRQERAQGTGGIHRRMDLRWEVGRLRGYVNKVIHNLFLVMNKE